MASCVPGELIPCAFVWHDPGITPCCRSGLTLTPRMRPRAEAAVRSVLALPAIFTRPGVAIIENFHRRGLAKRPQGVADAALASA
jgi:hypothetical protein